MSGTTITEVVKDKVYCLHNPLLLDGRLSAYPKRIIAQLEKVLDRTTPLSLFPLRITEYMSVGNALAISRAFNVRECYATTIDALLWLDLESTSHRHELPDVASKVLRGELMLDPTGCGRRPMVAFNAPIRLLNTAWMYDEVSKILFSSDMFTHVWSDKAEGPWLIGGDDGVTSNAFVRAFLLNTGFWWLEGARCDPLRKNVRQVFETYDIEMICPGYGAILKGREAVKKQFDVLDAVLSDLDRSKVSGRYIPHDLVR